MKKKILLFAGTVLASMALAVSAYAAPTAEGNTVDDSTQILAEALQHTLKPGDADYALYDIDGNEPGLTVDVTANDAALAFKRSIVKTQYYLEFKAGKFSKNFVLTPYSGSIDSAEAKVKDMVEDTLAIGHSKAETLVMEKAYNSKVKNRLMTAISKIHFNSGSEKVGEVYLTDTTGWAIFADAVAPLLKGEDVTLIAAKYDRETKTASGDSKYAAADLSKIAADGDVSFKELQDAYTTVYNNKLVIIDQDEAAIKAAIVKAANNAMNVGNAAKKYSGKLTLNEGTAKEVVYTYNDKVFTKAGVETPLETILDDASGLYSYDDVTIAAINDKLGTGAEYTEADENGETIQIYGTAKVEVTGANTKTGTVRLVKRK